MTTTRLNAPPKIQLATDSSGVQRDGDIWGVSHITLEEEVSVA